jgi:hypothetical protein
MAVFLWDCGALNLCFVQTAVVYRRMGNVPGQCPTMAELRPSWLFDPDYEREVVPAVSRGQKSQPFPAAAPAAQGAPASHSSRLLIGSVQGGTTHAAVHIGPVHLGAHGAVNISPSAQGTRADLGTSSSSSSTPNQNLRPFMAALDSNTAALNINSAVLLTAAQLTAPYILPTSAEIPQGVPVPKELVLAKCSRDGIAPPAAAAAVPNPGSTAKCSRRECACAVLMPYSTA